MVFSDSLGSTSTFFSKITSERIHESAVFYEELVDLFDFFPGMSIEPFTITKAGIDIPYLCHVFKPSASLRHTLVVKDFLEKSYSKAGYSGFSFRYDTQYDLHSICISITNQINQKISAVLRCTLKTKSLSIPFEDGMVLWSVDNLSMNKLSQEHVVDINSFIYSEPRVLEYLFRKTAKILNDLSISRAFCLYDSSSKRYGDLYLNAGFVKCKECPPISFSGFLDKNNQPIIWQLMELTGETYTQQWLS